MPHLGYGGMKLFVYGSLRRGEPAHHLLAGATFIALAQTEPRFTLVDMGDYPALVEGGHTAVVGEIYDVDESRLADLDAYEEAPDVYTRAALCVEGHQVVTYVLPASLAIGCSAFAGGDWRRR